jgi:hypothetical protein
VYRIQDIGDQVGTWRIEVTGTGAAAGTDTFQLVVDPRWPSDLLNTNALTSIENVELMLDRVGSQGSRGDEADDLRWIARLINSFSKTIQDETGRQFMPTENAVTKIFSYDNTGSLGLAPTEARAITTVTAYSDIPGSEEVWTPAYTGGLDYWAMPREQTSEGTYLWLEVPRRYYWGRGDIQVSILGNWGAGVVPEDVAYVCEAEVANAYNRATARVTSLEGLEVNDVGPFALSRRSLDILSAYRNTALLLA